MSKKFWYMVTLVGKDTVGIVAAVSNRLYEQGCDLGEASMMRLGGNFTIMLMVATDRDEQTLYAALRPVAEQLGLRCHVDAIEGQLHDRSEPDARISVHGADRPGIVAQVTSALAAAGFNIMDLESDVAGTSSKPVYVVHIEGSSSNGIASLEQALAALNKDIQIKVSAIETMLG